MASSRRKQDEKHLKILRELVSKPANRTCFDCHQKGPTYINMTIGSFVCTTCSGILRGLNPPHRVKSISMASFTSDEVDQIKSKGNQYCQAVWLGLYNGKSNIFPDTKDEHKIRDFMINKYEKKRFYVDPVVALKNGENSQIKSESSSSASTPGSDSRSLGAITNANSFSSVSRPIANIQNAGSSPSLNGLQTQNSSLKMSSSVDLLNSLGKSTNTPSGGLLTSDKKDPFNTPVASQQLPSESFANFENANIFSSASISKPTPNPYLPFSSNPLTPLSFSSSSSAKPPVSGGSNPLGSVPNVNVSSNEDRYAALKDLDEAFKCQKEVEITASSNSTMFGSPPNGTGQLQTASVFGTSPVSGGNGFYPPNVPPINQTWNATFPPVNPFSGNGSSNTNVGTTWTNGSKFVNSQGGQQQSNPFAGGADPNFNNSQFMSGFGVNNANTNSNWSNFGNTSNLQNGSNKLNTNPWGSGVTPNPFNVPPVGPPNGTSYNPFL